jgi:hypothetical protein
MPSANHSPELDQVRRMLFPSLSPEEGWARIDWAIRGAADPDKQQAIERQARQIRLGALGPRADG